MDIDTKEIVNKYADALAAWGRIYCSDRVWIDGSRWDAQPKEQREKLNAAEESLKGVEPIFHGSDKEAYDRVMQHISFYKSIRSMFWLFLPAMVTSGIAMEFHNGLSV